MKRKSLRVAAWGLSVLMGIAFMPSASFATSGTAAGTGSSQSVSKAAINAASEKLSDALEQSENSDIFDYVGNSSENGKVGGSDGTSEDEVFDLSDGRITNAEDAKNVITPVKFQNPFGSCWGFASIAAAEGSIVSEYVDKYDKNKDEVRNSMDLSEKHLAWFSQGKIEDTSDSQYGEGLIWNKSINTSDYYNTGGNMELATGLFASGVGPVDESREDVEKSDPGILKYYGLNKKVQYKKVYDSKSDSYKSIKYCYSNEDDWTIPYKYRFYQSYKLEQSYMLPSPAGGSNAGYSYNEDGTNAIKEQLKQGRPVAIGFCADNSSPDEDISGQYINLDTWAHYTYDDDARANHAVTIVGYDDNYDKSNFNEDHQPPENGAFLVKNSWGASENSFPNNGAGWGIEVDGKSTGYFWISYYDKSISMVESFDFDLEHEGNSDYWLDQYDYAPEQNPVSAISDTLSKSSNIFTAEETESLFSVSCQTATPGTKVTYQIYVLNNNAQDPEDGYLAGTYEETYDYGGFHKYNLPDEDGIIIQKGQKYSIVVTQQRPDGQYTAFVNSINKKVTSSDGTLLYEGNTVINEGESYLYDEGAWLDFKDVAVQNEKQSDKVFDNFPIKGYAKTCSDIQMRANANTVTIKPGDTYRLRVTFKGADVDELTDDTVTWENSDESIAELIPYKDTKGRSNDTIIDVKAKGVGTSYVYAKNPTMGSVIIKIVVPVPEELSEVWFHHYGNNIEIHWAKDVGATGYTLSYWTTASDKKTIDITPETYSKISGYELTSLKNYQTYKISVSGYSYKTDGSKVSGPAKTVTVTLHPQSTKITSLKGAKKRFTVQWTKRTCTGYQICYSTKKSMKNAKTITVKGSGTVSRKVTGLKAGTRYYVKVRTYNKDNEGTFTSDWSQVKNVKTKK